MLKQLNVSDLVPGMMVTQVLQQSGPVKIRKVGFIRSADMIRGLTEMGVSVVEVDINQSLNVELEDDEIEHDELEKEAALQSATSSKKSTTIKQTATQRLVVSNRQIADVDRQLSQQFHRSLFLPAVDQMPSKWMLYGKPYSLLIVFIICGFLVGAAASYVVSGILGPTGFSALSSEGSNSPKNNDSEQNTIVSDTSTASMQNTANNSNNKSVNNSGNKVLSESIPEKEQNMAASPVATQVTQTQTELSQSVQNDANSPVSSSKPATNPSITATSQPKPKTASQSINGVALEEGQQVLGYQSDSDAETDYKQAVPRGAADTKSASERSGRLSVSNRNNGYGDQNEDLNSNLMRRIQAAAQDVDKAADLPKPEILKVTNLNELPRIDQLSPAILTQMPAMSFSAHMYASNPRDRWVRVNSKRLGEGDVIANNVVLRRIESEKVVLEYNGTQFTMNALSDW